MNLTTWSFILSIAALILAVPLTVLGNFLTPKIRDWWALTSQRRFDDRIRGLKTEIEDPPSVAFDILKMVAILVPVSTSVLLLQMTQAYTPQNINGLLVRLWSTFSLMFGLPASIACVDILYRMRDGEKKYHESYLKRKNEELAALIRKAPHLNSTAITSISNGASPALSSSPARGSSPPRS